VVDAYAKQGFPQFDNDQIQLRTQPDLAGRRFDGAEDVVYYPALAVPLGAEDELVCPSNHVEVAKQWLDRMDGVNLLVIGNSGLDREVLRLFLESGNKLRRMLVANGSGMGRPTADYVAEAFAEKNWPDEWATGHGFSTLVDSGELRRWMSEVANS